MLCYYLKSSTIFSLSFIILLLIFLNFPEGGIKARKDEELIPHLEELEGIGEGKMILKEKRTVQKIHKVISKKECSNDIAKEIKDKKVARCSSCQMFSSKAGWM